MISAAERVLMARAPERPVASDYIENILDGFIPLAGDRLHGEDKSILAGIGSLDGIPVTVIGQLKGRTIEENIERRFGMASPEGYRKAQRLMKQAEKFHRPVITFVDTPGAYPGIEAEAADPLIQPERRDLFAFFARFFAVKIEVGHDGGVDPQIGNAVDRLVPGRKGVPHGVAVEEARVSVCVQPIHLRLSAFGMFAGVEEIGMAVGRAVEHEIEQDAHPAFICLAHEFFQVFHRAVFRRNGIIIEHTVFVVMRRRVDGGKPNSLDAKPSALAVIKVVKLLRDALQIADPVSV